MLALSNYATKCDWLAAAIALHDLDECLLWPFAVDRDGYGRVCYYGSGKKERVFAHRVAFKLAHGKWPEPLGLHKCDTPRCFNPRHIEEGTHQQNQNQKASRGRSLKGVQQHDAKLTEDQVKQIRVEYVPRQIGFQKLAKKYGVSKPIIQGIISKKLWRHVA